MVGLEFCPIACFVVYHFTIPNYKWLRLGGCCWNDSVLLIRATHRLAIKLSPNQPVAADDEESIDLKKFLYFFALGFLSSFGWFFCSLFLLIVYKFASKLKRKKGEWWNKMFVQTQHHYWCYERHFPHEISDFYSSFSQILVCFESNSINWRILFFKKII